eukprot:m.502366 g.502366  ORF g.502366 m.502366 type:complete len:267 (+) comp57338_c0_seq6:54-854(+)
MHRLVAVAAAVCAVLLVSTVHAQATGWVLGAPGEISCARVCRNTGLASMQFINTPERFVYLNAHFRTPNCTSFYNCTCDFAPAIHPPTGTCYFNYCGTSKVEANPATITGNYSRLQRYCCCNPRGCISQPSFPPPLSKWNFSEFRISRLLGSSLISNARHPRKDLRRSSAPYFAPPAPVLCQAFATTCLAPTIPPSRVLWVARTVMRPATAFARTSSLPTDQSPRPMSTTAGWYHLLPSRSLSHTHLALLSLVALSSPLRQPSKSG